MAKKTGKNQVDLKPIRKAIQKAIADLIRTKSRRRGGPTPKQKIEIVKAIVRLKVLDHKAHDICCDGSHNCPCPDPQPHPLS